MRDVGRPLGAGLQEQGSNHLKLLWASARVVNVEEKGRARLCQVRIKETKASEPLMTYPKQIGDVKTEWFHCLGISSNGTCLQPERHPVWRRRELDPGSRGQMGTYRSDGKGEIQVEDPQE
jgi:hypothetical protein